MTAVMSDAGLIAAHVAGDPLAFTELVRRHRDRMWAIALRTLGDPDEAADAVQDALISAFRSASGFVAKPRSPPGCIGSWSMPVWIRSAAIGPAAPRHYLTGVRRSRC